MACNGFVFSPASYTLPHHTEKKMQAMLFIMTGIGVGILSGLLGLGGGIVLIPVLVLFFGFSQHMAQGTSTAMMIPPIVSALMWKVILLPTNQGVLNHLLGLAGIRPIAWLGDSATAMISLILIDVWIYSPFAVLIFTAGLQSIPKEPYEAAQVDGASGWFMFRKLTLPLLAPNIVLVTLLRLIDSLKVFDIIYATTKGGPAGATMTLHIQSYFEAIRWFRMGRGMVYLFVLWSLCFIFSKVLSRLWTRVLTR